MKKSTIGKFALPLLLIVSFVFLLVYYQPVIFHPNNFLFNARGDAIKNYFTYTAHINESGYLESHLMNYPYGESFLYLDCHPLFTMVLKALSKPFPSVVNYSVGIINFLMIISLLISAVFLYLIFVELKVNKLLAALAGFSIAVLSPQLFRMLGHLALSYSFFIPVTWYFFIKFSKSSKKFKWSVILFVNNLSWYFVHAYLGMILVSFVFFCFVIDFFFYDKKKYYRCNQLLYVALQTIIPLLLFWIFAALSDSHTGRTNNPYGFLVYTSNPSTIFIPHHPPLKPYINKIIPIIQKWEGLAYIGIITTISVLLFLINLILKRLKKKTIIDDTNLPVQPYIPVAVGSAIVLLLLSMGLPFKLGLQFLLDWFPVIKNFRGIGRFAWVFYYVVTVSFVYYFYLLYEKGTHKTLFLSITIALPVSLFFEGITYHEDVSRQLTNCPNYFDENQLDETLSAGVIKADSSIYQAIIPLPFYHIGSENYGSSGTNKIHKFSMLLGYHSHIPILSNYSTRTSILESKNLVQLTAPSFYKKEIEKDIHSEKLFLILYSHEDLSSGEKGILNKGDIVFSCEEYDLLSVSKGKLFENTAKYEIKHFNTIKESLVQNNGFLMFPKDSNSFVLYISFDDKPTDKLYRGNGAFTCSKSDYNLLVEIEPGILSVDREYEVSLWINNSGENYGQDVLNSMLFVQSEDTVAKKQEWIANTNPAKSSIINGNWSMVELSFKISDQNAKISVYIKGGRTPKINYFVDDLLIREKGTDVYKIIEKRDEQIIELFKNNYKIRIN